MSFTLLGVLGSGSSRLSCHHRLPLAAYQAGSILVLWDYTRLGEDSRKFILLQPGQRCSELFFTKDGQHVLGFWPHHGRLKLSIWRCATAAKLLEHQLSETSPLQVDVHPETQHVLLLHGVSVVSATVMLLDGLSPKHVAAGPLGTLTPCAARVIDDGRHFAVGEAHAVHFWSYAGRRAPQQVLRVELPKALSDFQVQGRLAYLLPENGKLQVMNFQGERVQVAPPPLPATCFDVLGSTVCVGCADGSIMLSRSCPDHWKTWPCPATLCHTMPPSVSFVSLAANEDYACVCFEDATHGVIHLSSGQYVALRAGHVGSIRSLSVAPQLRAPMGLASRVLDLERVLRTKALAFLSVGAERSPSGRGMGCIAWPKMGPPVRGLGALEMTRFGVCRWLERAPEIPGREGCLLAPASLVTAVFHPSACLASDGSLTGAYVIIAGAEDGSIHVLQAEARSEQVAWRTQRVRVRDAFQPEVTQLPGEVGARSCCSLDVSPCGSFVLASYADGAVDLLDFPALERLTELQRAPRGEVRQKAAFVWRPTERQRAYDTNLYAVSHQGPKEVVLHEVYALGDSFVKAVQSQFVLMAVCQAAGGFFTDFCVHPSQLYLVAAAVLPASDVRSILLVYDLWSGELLSSVEVFTSLLVAPNEPLQPSLCFDCSGSFIFCASTPTRMGPLDLHFQQGDPGRGLASCSDLLSTQLREVPEEESTSLLCAVDFRSGEPCYQASINAGCIALGSPWHDPCQLLVGARDGTISLWQPPESMSERIRSMLQEGLEAYSKLEALRLDGALSAALSQVQAAMSFLWATKTCGEIDWATWGRPSRGDPAPILPLAATYRSPPPVLTSDVVVEARQEWIQPPTPEPMARPLAVGFLGAQPEPMGIRVQQKEPEIDPVSGLEVFEMPLAPAARQHLEPLNVPPELREEFGTRAEHTAVEDLGREVISELERFERCFPAAQAPETPREP